MPKRIMSKEKDLEKLSKKPKNNESDHGAERANQGVRRNSELERENHEPRVIEPLPRIHLPLPIHNEQEQVDHREEPEPPEATDLRPPNIYGKQLNEYYINHHYATTKGGNQYVAKVNGKTTFCLNKEQEKIYPVRNVKRNDKMEQIEYAPLNEDGIPLLITQDNGNVKYTFNQTTQEPEFPLNGNGEQIYLKNTLTDQEIYPVNVSGKPFYARDLEGRPKLIRVDGKLHYSKDRFGNETYPTDPEGNEQYILNDAGDIEMPAVSKDNIPFYAKRANGDEFYPVVYTQVVIDLNEPRTLHSIRDDRFKVVVNKDTVVLERIKTD